MSESFEAAISRSLGLAPPSAGDNLAGFEADIHAALDRLPGVGKRRIKRTGDPRRMLEVIARFEGGAGQREGLAAALAGQWADHVRYDCFAAHELIETADAVELRFATRSGDGPEDRTVTGSIAISLPPAG
ncbi:MAG TPA: hypothetical protein VGE07_11275 [Herpetosiphonaceae bacterium]